MLKKFFKKGFQLSIRTKILFLGTGLVILSFSTFLPYILNTFLQDKKAYVYDAVLTESHDIQTAITRLLESKDKDLLAYSLQPPVYFQSEEFKKAAMKEHLLQYERYNYDGQFRKVTSVVYEPALRNHTLERNNLEELSKTPWDRFPSMIPRKRFLEYIHVGPVPLLRIFHYDEASHSLHFASYVADDIIDTFSKSSSFTNSLMTVSGNTLESTVNIKLPSDVLEKLATGGTSEAVITQEIGKKKYLIAFSKIVREDWLALSVIDEGEAYKVSYFLLKKTLAFAGIIISLGVILGTLLAKSLTTPISDLVAGTEQVSKGNFRHVIPKRAEDELGQLSDSFNFMNKEILRYIDEVKEKSRMENELAVAQVVQSSFFPDKKIITPNFSVMGYYNSASECGGDWWGAKTIGDKSVLFIADATGHGVHAALITATANCVGNLLPQICEEHPELLESPAKILEYFNLAVFKAGGKILMTFFIGIYDKKTKVLKYANASHNPPYLYRYSESEPQKSDVTLLLDAEGPRLGHHEDPVYTEGTAQMNDQDVLIMYTDGIVEAEKDHKPYGDRRFMKSVLKHVKSGPEAMIPGLITDMEEFLQGALPDDDVTLIIAKRELT